MCYFMPNVTLSFSDETKKRMRRHPEIKWSSVVRSVIERKLDDFEQAERLAGKSALSEKDVAFLSFKVNRALGKHARKLLNESHG